jgi:hypothetical protein
MLGNVVPVLLMAASHVAISLTLTAASPVKKSARML